MHRPSSNGSPDLPTVTVVIPAWRAAKTIARAVASVLAQTAPALEVLVVNDGSDDASALAQALAPFGQQVTLLHKPNGGAASARNHGIAKAQGHFVTFLDADDTWEPTKLERQLAVFQTHPELGMVGANHFVQEPGQPLAQDCDVDTSLFDRVLRVEQGRSFHTASKFWTGTVMIRRELLLEDRFDEGLSTAEDRDLWFRLLCKAPAFLLSEPLATCVLEPGSLSRTHFDRDMANLLLIIERHRERMGEQEYARNKARTHLRWTALLRAHGRADESLTPAWESMRHAPSAKGAWRVARAMASSMWPASPAATPQSGLHVQLLQSQSELLGLRDEWHALYERCPLATVSTCWEWMRTWWEVFGVGRDLQLLVVRDHGRLVGVAPLLWRELLHLGVGPVRRVEMMASGEPAADEIHTEYLEFLIEPGREGPVCAALWQEIKRLREWDELLLPSVPAAAARMRMALRDAASSPRLRIRERQRPQAVVIGLEPTVDAFVAAQSRKMREDLRRQRRMLEQHGSLHLVRAGSLDELRSLFPVLINLHQALWTSRGEPGCFASAAFTRFHQLVSERLFESGQTHLHVLYVGEQAVAARYGFHRGTRMFEYQSGNDPVFDPRIGLGMVSMQMCMEDAIARGMSEYDMGEGPRPYKLRWRHELRSTFDVEISQRNLRIALVDQLKEGRAALRRWRTSVRTPAAHPVQAAP